MTELSATVRLRPTRIGFLTSPTDLSAVRQIMRICTCLWGGTLNPIIPVFTRSPAEWRSELPKRHTGIETAKGYVRYFEPDVYVEAEKGMLEKAGLGAFRNDRGLHTRVTTLGEFLVPSEDRKTSEPRFGQSIFSVLSHIYKTDTKFVRRDKRECFYVAPTPKDSLSEAIFGNFPTGRYASYLKKAYFDVFNPELLDPSPSTWRRIFTTSAETPLRTTHYSLTSERHWYDDVTLFVFDPSRAPDLIDLWNLRLESRPVLPVPVEWFEPLSEDICRVISAQHRPIVGNPHGLMHKATIEFGRSISKGVADSLVKGISDALPGTDFYVKNWRNDIWVEKRDTHASLRGRRLSVSAKERRVTLELKDRHLTFETLHPDFSGRYRSSNHRWVNTLSISSFTNRRIATVLPFNTLQPEWPRLGLGSEFTLVGSEGWVFTQEYKNIDQYVSLIDADAAIIGSLSRFGIKAKLSEPGQIARQMLEKLGGLSGVRLLADIETLNLLNKSAGRLRRRANDVDTTEENFELRAAPLKDWQKLISSRRGRRRFAHSRLEDFTKCNVVRLGLETDCPHCHSRNWSSLTDVDYRVTCERCLTAYDFPQATLRDNNKNFSYRVIGPFSVPDFGRGSYSALLTLRAMNGLNSSTGTMTFSTAMELSCGDLKCEVDFVCWRGESSFGEGSRHSPQLVIGESKSIGKGDLISSRDLDKLKAIADKLPGVAIVLSVLRDCFTETEKAILRRFVKWGRRPNAFGEPTNPILLFTSHELTMDYTVAATWKEIGGDHARFSDYRDTSTLVGTADATQQIYLGIPSFFEERRKNWEKRRSRRRKR
jgi:hypothetical protein